MGYFTDLGFKMPEMINPADFFMDIIAGKYIREGDENFKASDLFTLWVRNL